MAYPIDKKLVIAVSSSALFDLSESDRVFNEEGELAYQKYQDQHIDSILDIGAVFPFVKRFLSINDNLPGQSPVEVVLLSRNSPATGRRVFRSIQAHGLNITRAAFLAGASPFPYIPAFNASIFLSANEADARNAIQNKYPAGIVLPSQVVDTDDHELRVAFDFDGVIADDGSEKIYQSGGIDKFQEHESEHRDRPLNAGPLANLFKGLSKMQKLEDRAQKSDKNYKRILRISIITARNAPAHERVVSTLEQWGVSPSEAFFVGGMKKERILSVLKPHVFFDDQMSHLQDSVNGSAMVHIPFGVRNTTIEEN